ncbi:hypothetical protein Sjap_002622 [Stephania japonica]|uniref:Uncharacterized protein n=1 Tax=Stephania japonica TaxID=461633 RepID=A0AAP0KM73_9MAGN
MDTVRAVVVVSHHRIGVHLPLFAPNLISLSSSQPSLSDPLCGSLRCRCYCPSPSHCRPLLD